MTREYSIAEARNRFTSIVRELEATSPIRLTRRGKVVAVLLPIGEYERLAGGGAGFWEKYRAFGAATDLAGLAIDPDLFESARDRSPGPETPW